MEITYNDKEINCTDDMLLYDFVFDQIGEKQNGIAVALNYAVIPKSEWKNIQLKSQDKLLIIKATQGG